MRRKKAFTLIELLAVIVILAVIALIATPIILSILTKVRKSAFQDSAYGIMEAAKSYYAESIIDENNPEDKVFSFEEGVMNDLYYSGSKPKGGMLILSETGEIELAIRAIKGKTESNVKLIKYEKSKCKIPDGSKLLLISVKNSQSETIEKGLDKPILEYFNVLSSNVSCIDTSNGDVEMTNTNSLDIGTHTIKCIVTEDEETVSANKTLIVEVAKRTLTEEMMVAEVGSNGSIRKDNLGNSRYAGSNPNNYVCFGTQNDTCDEEHLYRIIGIIDGKVKLIKNSFYSEDLKWDTGSNNWDRPATLKTELNGSSFYENTNYIDEISKGYIAETTWYTGASDNWSLASFEDTEKNSSSIGYVGLMSVTDFGYSSNNTECERTTNLGSENNACMSNNYLFNNRLSQWTITPFSSGVNIVSVVDSQGSVLYNNVYHPYRVRPSLFLKPEVKIISGKGTEIEPYRLSK